MNEIPPELEYVRAALMKACFKEFGSTWSNDVTTIFARAALLAIRIPTAEMKSIGRARITKDVDESMSDATGAAFTAMIDHVIGGSS